MKKFIAVILALLTLLSVLSGCGTANISSQSSASSSAAQSGVIGTDVDTYKTYSLAQLQEDFVQLQTTIESKHGMLFTDKEELAALFETQYALLKDGMSELEFYRVVAPIVSKLNCGHTGIDLSDDFLSNVKKDYGRFLPYEIKVIDGKAYVITNFSSSAIPVRSEILSINGKSINDILDTFLNSLTADGSNLTKKYRMINHSFSDAYFNFIDSPESFIITYKTGSDDIITEITAPSISQGARDSAIEEFNSSKQQDSSSGPYSFEEDYAVLTIETFNYGNTDSRNEFKASLDSFFSELSERKISNLILDLRGNGGGDLYCAAYLFSYLISEAFPYLSDDFDEAAGNAYISDLTLPIPPAENNFQGQLYVLINGASFSATSQLIALLRYHKIGTLIGEESAGSDILTSFVNDYTLGNTKLKFHCSSLALKVAVTGLIPGRGIYPDYPISPSIDDYINGTDSIKDFVIGLIESKK